MGNRPSAKKGSGRMLFAPSVIAFVSVIPFGLLLAESADYQTMMHALKQEREQLVYLDASVTYAADPSVVEAIAAEPPARELTPEEAYQKQLKEKEARKHEIPGTNTDRMVRGYLKSIQNDYHAHIEFLSGHYGESHKSLVKARAGLMDSYLEVLDFYIAESEAFFKAAAPLAVKTHDMDAGFFIRQGYRDLANAKKKRLQSYNIYPGNVVMRIELYRQALQHIRLARRFLILALINGNLPKDEKNSYQYISYERAKHGPSPAEKQVAPYEQTRYLLLKLMERKRLVNDIDLEYAGKVRRVNLLNIHRDNYFYLPTDRESSRKQLIGRVEREFQTERLRTPVSKTGNNGNQTGGNATSPGGATAPSSSSTQSGGN